MGRNPVGLQYDKGCRQLLIGLKLGGLGGNPSKFILEYEKVWNGGGDIKNTSPKHT